MILLNWTIRRTIGLPLPSTSTTFSLQPEFAPILADPVNYQASAITKECKDQQKYRITKHSRIAEDNVFYCRHRGCKRRLGGGGKGFVRKDNRNTHEKTHKNHVAYGSQVLQQALTLPQQAMTSGMPVGSAREVFNAINGGAYHATPGEQQIAERFGMSGALI